MYSFDVITGTTVPVQQQIQDTNLVTDLAIMPELYTRVDAEASAEDSAPSPGLTNPVDQFI